MSTEESETKPSKITVSYKECRRNHAVSISSHAVDGCREFSPAGEQGTEQGFLCEACGCHRSFHRKEVIRNGGVGRATPPALPLLPPNYAVVPTVVPVGGYSTLPFMVLHPVDYNYSLPQQPSGQSDHHDLKPEQKPNAIKRPKVEPF